MHHIGQFTNPLLQLLLILQLYLWRSQFQTLKDLFKGICLFQKILPNLGAFPLPQDLQLLNGQLRRFLKNRPYFLTLFLLRDFYQHLWKR